MSSNILAIGLNTILTDQLNIAHPTQVTITESCDEAINVLRLWDINTIVIDSGASLDVKLDIEKLLSVTPITTKIVLITPATDITANKEFSSLGITTITGPISETELEPYFH
jgi:hypothetical protein